MALYFGLNITRSLTDVPDPELALLNLDLDIRDLNRIRGLRDAGVSRNDLKTLSRLDMDFEKEVSSLKRETNTYVQLTTNVYDESSLIKANVNINGQLGASSIKYKYVDWEEPVASNKVKYADISTSRVSSWSSFDNSKGAAAPIFYGGEVMVEGKLELSTLAVNDNVVAKRFTAEIPTHKIKVHLTDDAGGDQTLWLYAMKGIPLVFNSFFRSCSVFARITQISGVRPSWVIKNTSDGREYVWRDELSSDGTSSSIYLGDTSAKARELQFYYPISNLYELYLPSIGLIEMPAVALTALRTLTVSYNDFRTMPNFTGFTSLLYLDISNNDLSRASATTAVSGFGTGTLTITSASNSIFTATISGLTSVAGLELGMTLRQTSGTAALGNGAHVTSIGTNSITIKSVTNSTAGTIVFSAYNDLGNFSPAITYKLPTSIDSVYMGNCFRNDCTADFTRLTNLVTLNLDVPYWYDKRLTGTSPAVFKDYAAPTNDKIQNYSLSQCSFSVLHPSVQKAKSLRTINLTWNNISGEVNLESTVIYVFVGWGNSYPIVKLPGRTQLVEYYAGYNGYNDSTTRQYINDAWEGCTALRVIYAIYMNAKGPMPKFAGCDNLVYINFWGTQIEPTTRVVEGATKKYVLDEPGYTFSDAGRTKIQYIVANSPYFGPDSEFNPRCFNSMPSLYYVEISSSNNGIGGSLPTFGSARNIVYVLLYNNQLTGSIGDFDGCNSLFYLHLYSNRLTGAVPNIKSPNFQHLLLGYNQLSSFNKIDSVTLRRLHLPYNNITSIPDMSNLIYLDEFLMNNQQGGNVSYTTGSFVGLRSIRFINIANNGISSADCNQILIDMLDNYNANPRGGVTINLSGNAGPTTSDTMFNVIRNLQSVGWSIQL